jgi:hypothetical protein
MENGLNEDLRLSEQALLALTYSLSTINSDPKGAVRHQVFEAASRQSMSARRLLLDSAHRGLFGYITWSWLPQVFSLRVAS